MTVPAAAPPRHVPIDPTPEIFATDGQGGFSFQLAHSGSPRIDTASYDEIRLIVSIWHPSGQRSIDLDRAYVEVRGAFDRDEHWFKLAEVEPVVPPYGADSFDGWIMLPVFAGETALALSGAGFDPRARLQVRAAAYLVA